MKADLHFVLHPLEKHLIKVYRMPPSMNFIHNRKVCTFDIIHRLILRLPPPNFETCAIGLCSDLWEIPAAKYRYLFDDLFMKEDNEKKFLLENLILSLLKKYFTINRRKRHK